MSQLENEAKIPAAWHASAGKGAPGSSVIEDYTMIGFILCKRTVKANS